jgi:hypothetical protein
MSWQQAIMIRPRMAITNMMKMPSVRSHKFNTLAMGIRHAALITLVTMLITVSSEWLEKSLVMYADRLDVKLLLRPLTKYNIHMLSVS